MTPLNQIANILKKKHMNISKIIFSVLALGLVFTVASATGVIEIKGLNAKEKVAVEERQESVKQAAELTSLQIAEKNYENRASAIRQLQKSVEEEDFWLRIDRCVFAKEKVEDYFSKFAKEVEPTITDAVNEGVISGETQALCFQKA